MKTIYLDHAAATPMEPLVRKAMEPYFTKEFFNPSAIYLAAKKTKQALDDARAEIAKTIGSRPPEIIFTSGGTEANNLAIRGVAEAYPGKQIIVSAIEHDSVLAPSALFDAKLCSVDELGNLKIDELKKLITHETVLVSVMLANNEVGTIQPVSTISQIIEEVRVQRLEKGNDLPIFLHTDAAQAGNYLDLSVGRLGVDMMTINGGKLYGPKQTGVLYVKAGIILKSQILGGGQESGIRSGTENVAGAVGLAKALTIAQKTRKTETKRLKDLQAQLISGLNEINGVEINGSKKHRLPNNVHFTIPGTDNERLIMELDENAVMCAAGSACSASKDLPSHVLKAMGLSDSYAQASIRMTLGRGTTEDDIEGTLKILNKLIQK